MSHAYIENHHLSNIYQYETSKTVILVITIEDIYCLDMQIRRYLPTVAIISEHKCEHNLCSFCCQIKVKGSAGLFINHLQPD